MIIFDVTLLLNGKMPEGCIDCPFMTNEEGYSDLYANESKCALTSDYICKYFLEGDISPYLKLTTCPLKEVEG